MAGRKFEVVKNGAVPDSPSPETLEDAVDLDRDTLLKRARLELARAIDAGPPAHALSRLIVELKNVDAEIRQLKVIAKDEVARESSDAKFDASAI